MLRVGLLLILAQSVFSLHCHTCHGVEHCKTEDHPVECPEGTQCYTLHFGKNVIARGCSESCERARSPMKASSCTLCDWNGCNLEKSKPKRRSLGGGATYGSPQVGGGVQPSSGLGQGARPQEQYGSPQVGGGVQPGHHSGVGQGARPQQHGSPQVGGGVQPYGGQSHRGGGAQPRSSGVERNYEVPRVLERDDVADDMRKRQPNRGGFNDPYGNSQGQHHNSHHGGHNGQGGIGQGARPSHNSGGLGQGAQPAYGSPQVGGGVQPGYSHNSGIGQGARPQQYGSPQVGGGVQPNDPYRRQSKRQIGGGAGYSLTCHTCSGTSCQYPRTETCPAYTQCYTLYESSMNLQVVGKGCARDCSSHHGRHCVLCSSNLCNSAIYTQPAGTGYNPYGNNPYGSSQVGGGAQPGYNTGYNSGNSGIGQGAHPEYRHPHHHKSAFSATFSSLLLAGLAVFLF